MKSIKSQFIDLKEGKLTQQNFMRNLRRDMPHLVTNVTSFKDAIRILKNKSILSEGFEDSNSAKYIWDKLDYDERVTQALVFVKDPDEAELYADKNWDDLPDFLSANLSRELPIAYDNDNVGTGDERDPEAEYFEKALRYQERGDDMDRDDGLWEKKLSGENNYDLVLEIVKSYEDDDLLEDFNKNFELNQNITRNEFFSFFTARFDDMSELSDVKKNWEYVESGGDDMDRDFEDRDERDEDKFWDYDDENQIDRNPGDDYNDGEFWEGKINEAKTKITAAQAHPQELAMGRKVEMEHTDNVETAEKIALDHLSEDPFYYTKLHVAGLADELNRPKEKKSTKKRTDLPTEVGKDNFTDKGNQMTLVKNIEKVKADANKAKKETNKGVGKITLMSLIAIKPRGVEKMAATGEKMKKIIVKESIDKWKEALQNATKEEITKFVKEFTSNPSKYNITKDEMKDIVLSLKKKDKLEEDQPNIQNRADEINEFAKLVKSKDYNSIIEQYESIIQYPAEWNITPDEAMKILQKYFNDDDWDKFEEITSGGYDSDADSFENDMDTMSEASLNMLPNEEPNDIVIQAQEYIDSNPILRQLSDRIDLQNIRQEAAILKFDYWKPLNPVALNKLKLQFDVTVESDDDDDTGPITAYRLTPKLSDGTPDLGKYDLNTLKETIRKELKEYFDGRDNLTSGDDEDVNSDGNIMEEEVDFENFIKQNKQEIFTQIPDQYKWNFDINKPYNTTKEDLEVEGDSVTYFNHLDLDNEDGDENVCKGVTFFSYTDEELEGDGPVNNGVIIDVNGRKIQYQIFAC